jgi:hypothetical protein
MTNNNKFVPVAPKTYEVRYVENKQSGLSPAARNKVIKMHGSGYLSSRVAITNPSYGPGEDAANTKYCANSGCSEQIADSQTYCSKHSQLISSKDKKDLAEAAKDMPSGTEIEHKKEEKDAQGNYRSESVTVRKK